MEELHRTKDVLLEKLKDPNILKKTPSQIRALRNEIQEEFNVIIRQITEKRRKKRTKRKNMCLRVY